MTGTTTASTPQDNPDRALTLLLTDAAAPLRCSRCSAPATVLQVDLARQAPGAASPRTGAYCKNHGPAQDGGPEGLLWTLPLQDAARLLQDLDTARALQSLATRLNRQEAETLHKARRLLESRCGIDTIRLDAWMARNFRRKGVQALRL